MSNALTAKDQELLSALRLNARESVTTLARKLGLSRSTVQDRLKRLESRGIIAGYAVKLGDQVEQAALKAFVTIEIEPRRSLDVVRTLGKLSPVEQLYTVSGKYDIVAMLRTNSTQDLDRLLDEIGQIQGVTRTESAVVLSTKIDRR
ncbi:DNA-binding Lrp family transcriptional regulator [Rhodoligotrophos appendicifer]|uniref:Lrp/AsnC family transcriptional regulator n=1 Tax=Rhodoligotrophos appendicifer TaxID=987056 RepID=UPI00118520F3|nr:Lrp/AsnC family transcriptional regulator [Rhodoligotrophos appendicifer]